MSMVQRRIITLLGVLILLSTVGIGGFLLYEQYGPSSADATVTPKKVRITNVTDTSLAVSWTTAAQTLGSVHFGPTTELGQSKPDDLVALGAAKNHYVTLSNLEPATEYFLVVKADETEFDDNGIPYQITTATSLSSAPRSEVLTGSIQLPSSQPAAGALIYVTILDAYPLSTQVKADGSWLLSLSAARNARLTDYLSIDPEKTTINLLAQQETLQSQITTNLANANPVPTITLGENYDLDAAATTVSPPTTLTQTGSGLGTLNPTPEIFLQDFTPTASGSAEVTILNPAQNYEELYTTRPQFLGLGPISRVLSIRIAGVGVAVTGTTTVDTEGKWAYTPTQALAIGTYTLQVDFTDRQGVSRSLSRPFLISDGTGLGGDVPLPAFVSTPSATITPIPTATLSSLPLTSMPATDSGVPTSGATIPTQVLLVLGLVLLGSGYYVKLRH